MSDTPNPAPGTPNPAPNPNPAAPAQPATPPEAAAAPAAPAPAAAAKPAEPAKALTAEEKMARLAAARAANAAKAAAKAGGAPAPAAPAPAAATPATAAPAAASAPAAAAAPAKPFPPKAAESKESGVEASGAPANKPAAAHLAAAATAAPKAAGGAKAPKTPEVPLPPPPQLQTRRTFVEWAFGAWVVFFTFLGGCGAMFLRFMFPNVLYEADPRFIAGKRSEYPEDNHVYENFKQSQAVWIVRLVEDGQDHLVALSTVCTHLGCTPNWLEAEKKFKCPCHGSGYYMNGVNFEGPTPRPLERFRVFLDSAGNIIVDKSKKYRSDLQQWGDPESFVVIG